MLSVTELKEIEFSADLISKFEEIVTRYPKGKQKSSLLPILHLVQAEYGWISPEAMDKIAAFLQIQAIEVYEVATFYTMFFMRPQGNLYLRYAVQVHVAL